MQLHFEARRRHDEMLLSAYNLVLDAIQAIRAIRLYEAHDHAVLGNLAVRLIQLAELSDRQYPSMPAWFEAERQMLLSRLGRSQAATEALFKRAAAAGLQPSPDDIIDAGHPFYSWVADFGDNVRFWWTGKLDDDQILDQAQRIEKLLRDQGVWRERQWRTSSEKAGA